MTVLEPIANLIGLTVPQLIAVVVVGLALVGGWYVLKFVLKTARKVFSVGCVGIVVLLGILYVAFVIISSGR